MGSKGLSKIPDPQTIYARISDPLIQRLQNEPVSITNPPTVLDSLPYGQ